MKKKIIEKIKNSPTDPGCYIFKNRENKIIYIGKAKNIRKRISNYLGKNKVHGLKTIKLIRNIADVEFILANSEIDALILENNLIKEHQPKYNILLRDDKTFPYVKITNEYLPRVFITRKRMNDGAVYYGPYTEPSKLKRTIELIRRIFPIRRCNKQFNANNIGYQYQKVCLNFHINRCEGPCIGNVGHSQYIDMIENIKNFLNGKTESVVNYFDKKMKESAIELKFELAAKYRDNVKTICNLYSRQVVEYNDFVDMDVINIAVEDNVACSVLFKIRQGKIIGRETFFLDCNSSNDSVSILERFLQDYYSKASFIPSEVVIEEIPVNRSLLQCWLKEKARKSVKIIKGIRKTKNRILQMASKNAKLKLKEFIIQKNLRDDYIPLTLKVLQESLNLDRLPKRIEGFDISNINGTNKVGSLVCFFNAVPKKSEYRKFKIKTVQGADDFASLKEVITRRYSRVIKEKLTFPDLILIDGGKGQLSSVKEVLNKLGLANIPVIGLAKKLEEIFLPYNCEPIILAKDSQALILLRRIRDESHRFAITYHRSLRKKSATTSILDNIPGLGDKKKLSLYKHYKSIDTIRSISIEDLCDVEGIGPKLAQNIWICLHERK